MIPSFLFLTSALCFIVIAMFWFLWDASQGFHVRLVLALVLHWSIITSKNLYMVVAAFPLISELDALTNEEPKNSSYTWFGLVSFSHIFPPN